MQNEVGLQTAGHENDCDYLLMCQKTICFESTFVELRNVLSGQLRHLKNMMYDRRKQTSDVNLNGWQRCVKELGNSVKTLFVSSSSLVGAASDARSTTDFNASKV